ncbi:MAG: RDD family protein, partial [Bacteroidia bacterium]
LLDKRYFWKMESSVLDVEEIHKENDYRNFIAPKWKRLVNFLIDYYLILLIWFTGMVLITSYIDREKDVVSDTLFNVLIITPFILVFLLYFICERFAGKTLGKLMTGTKVISVFDEELTTNQILIRTLCRIIPFEPISLFFSDTAWHDDWSDTVVVTKKYKNKFQL